MDKLKLVFNPLTGNFDYVSKQLTKKEILGSVLLFRYEDVSETHPSIGILFDENSILYSDDNFNE
jgi:hypothetical protein